MESSKNSFFEHKTPLQIRKALKTPLQLFNFIIILASNAYNL